MTRSVQTSDGQSIQLRSAAEPLPQTQEMDDLQATFLQNVEHELRTPLAIIMGYAELLNDGQLGGLTSEQQKATISIVAHTHQLRTLVERITTLMAIKGGANTSAPVLVSLFVAEAVENSRAKAVQAGVTLGLEMEPSLPFITGDPYYLYQAFTCILENALKFTPAGGRVQVRAFSECGWVCLEVTDTGIGMAEEALELVFTPFVQIDGSTTRRHGGIGLGMAVAKAVVDAHQGQIEVKSQQGQGSQFTIRFPALSSTTHMAQPIEPDVSLRRILIVDDDENVGLTLKAVLRKLPRCETFVATSGEEALRLFEMQPFHLLIVDYQMPDINGVMLAERIRALYPQTTAIMITAYGSDELHRQAAQASIQCILNKPLELEEIRHVALQALEHPVLPASG